MTVPPLETDRLKLRGHRIEDFELCVALWGDALVTRYITGTPLSREDCWARLLGYVGHWALLGFGYWIVEEKFSGVFVGELGFADAKRGLGLPFASAPETGWAFVPSVHGKGYATEALRAILSWGKANLNSDETICLIHPENYNSMKVAEKCGFRRNTVATYKGQPTVVFAHRWDDKSNKR